MSTPPKKIYDGPTAEDLEQLPPDLKARPQWVLWRGADRLDRKTGAITGLEKIPYTTDPDAKASTTNPQTWASFERCVQALPVVLEQWEAAHPSAYCGGGIGYVFSADDPFVGIDLDHVVDTEAGTIAAWADAYLKRLGSYTEQSPTGTGLHILVKGTLPTGGRRKGLQVEMYDAGRFFTMTGWHLAGTPRTIEPRQEALTALHAEIFGALQATQHDSPPQAASTPQLDDSTLLDKARAAKNGPKFTTLWAGDTAAYDDDESAADMALCDLLAFWTQDPAQIDRLFRESGLMRDKWDSKRGTSTYGEQTIAEALARQSDHYRTPGGVGRRRNGDTPPAAEELSARGDRPLPYSDYTNALAFVRDHGQEVHYCYPWKSWLVWIGTHWQRDDTGSVHQDAKQTIKRLARHAENLDDDMAVKALMAHVKKSLSKASLDAMVRTAQDEPGIPVKPEAFDADPWLLNCTNGTLDLHTGTLRPHAKADLLTRCLPMAYDADATCPLWEGFLWRIMGGSQGADDPDMSAGQLENRQKADERARALIAFLQRAIGYTLTGSTREQCLFILHGKTKTGKSTFLATIRALLGPYGQQADMESFLHKDRQEVRNDLADLAGSRCVCALESQEGRRLAESLVKQLTGGADLIKARFLFQEYFSFRPQFKIFLGTNHKPVIRDTDSAIWERIRLVPFTVQIPQHERDKTLDERLQTELPGILAWAVHGCLEWQRMGELGEPDAVVQATAGYRSEMDTMARFLEECCITENLPEDARVKASALASAYQTWCKRTGELPLTNRAFIADLEEREYTRKPGHANQYYWHGLGLVNTEDERYD